MYVIVHKNMHFCKQKKTEIYSNNCLHLHISSIIFNEPAEYWLVLVFFDNQRIKVKHVLNLKCILNKKYMRAYR